jgi:hypothetical protein
VTVATANDLAGARRALGDHLRMSRERRQWDRRQVALIAGCPVSDVETWEAGGEPPSSKVWKKLKAALDRGLHARGALYHRAVQEQCSVDDAEATERERKRVAPLAYVEPPVVTRTHAPRASGVYQDAAAPVQATKCGLCTADPTLSLHTYQREPDRSRFAMSCPGGERTVLIGAVYRVDGTRNMRVIGWGQKRTSNHKTFRMVSVDEIRAAWTPEKPITWSRIRERVLLGADGYYRPMHPARITFNGTEFSGFIDGSFIESERDPSA